MATRKSRGFTIVELLIVIVIIAILAAIAIVAYTGIQQRANNSAIISAASSTQSVVQAYVAANSNYPHTSAVYSCITTDTGCVDGGTVLNGVPATDSALQSIGTVPRKAPVINASYTGIYLIYNINVTYGGASQPAVLVYYLNGNNQNCGLGRVVQYTWPALTASTTGYTSNQGTMTRCWVSIPGPGYP